MERKSFQPFELFYCYARKDHALRNELDKHLAGLRRSGLITAWYDGAISPGTSWEKEIKTHLNAAHVILLLVSPDFIYSDYCYSKEMTRALERHYANEARVVPVILRPVDWSNTPFSPLQVLPSDAQPITRWSDRDEALKNVANGIRQVVEELTAESNKIGKNSNIQVTPSDARPIPSDQKVILSIDDVMSGIRNLLNIDEQYTIIEALNGEEALRAINTIRPNIVLLDLAMPKMEGFEFLRQFRKIYNDVPVIVYTAHESSSYMVEAYSLGADDYFVKQHLQTNELLETVERLICNGRAKMKIDKEIMYLGKLKINLNTQEVAGPFLKGSLSSLKASADNILALMEIALASAPDNILAHYNRGYALQALKRNEEALEAFDQAICLAPDNALAHYNRGCALQALKHNEEAIKAFDQAICLSPTKEAYYDKFLLLYKLKQHRQAFEVSQQIIDAYPFWSHSYYVHSLAFYGIHNLGDAIRVFDQAINHDQKLALEHYKDSLAYYALGRYEETIAILEHSILHGSLLH